MGVMTDPPVCRLCGAAHWLREPHMFVSDVSVKIRETPAQVVPAPVVLPHDTPPTPEELAAMPTSPKSLANIALSATKRLKVAQDLLAKLRAGEKVPVTNAEAKRKSREYRKAHPNYRRGRTNAQRQKAYRERKKKQD